MQANFDRIARPYRALEYLTLGPLLQRCRLHYLPRLIDRRSALALGDGDGRFLARLLAQNPRLLAEAVDTSPAMLRLLRQRCAFAGQRLATLTADALVFTPSRTYDLVVTHFFLDCLTQSQLDTLLERIKPSLAPHALWLVSEFRIPAGALRNPARLLIRLLYLAFRILTGLRVERLPDFETSLTDAGFLCIARRHTLFGILTTQLWRLSAPLD